MLEREPLAARFPCTCIAPVHARSWLPWRSQTAGWAANFPAQRLIFAPLIGGKLCPIEVLAANVLMHPLKETSL